METLRKVLNFIKSKTVLFVVFLLLCTVSIFKTYNAIKPSSHNEVQQTIQLAPTKTVVDKQGIIHEQIKVRELTLQEMKVITDSIRKSIPGRVQIKEVVKYVTKSDTEFVDISVEQKGDSLEIDKADSYVQIKAIVDTKTKKGALEYASQDTLTFTRFARKHLLKANEEVVDITNKNPYNHIIEGASLVVKQPKVIAVVGPSITVNPLSGKVSWGASITFNAFSIKSKK